MPPASSWAGTGGKLNGYSKTNAGKTPQSKWYHNKGEQGAGGEKQVAQKTYETISRYFVPSLPSEREGTEKAEYFSC